MRKFINQRTISLLLLKTPFQQFSTKFVSKFKKINPNATSQIGKLNKVFIHRPTIGVGRISPKNAQQLLFDDIVNLQLMQKEHDVFTKILREFVGDQNVLQIKDMLLQTINLQSKNRQIITQKIIKVDNLKNNKEIIKKLDSLTNQQFVDAITSGYSSKYDQDLITPMSNFTFTRDIAITINKHILVTKAAKQARIRQHLVTGLIMNHHPAFSEAHSQNRILQFGDQSLFKSSSKQPLSIEGGDVMTIHKDYLLVGQSERTTGEAFNQLTKRIFQRKIIKNVVQMNIPQDRSCMHIDTIFTHINRNHVVAYKPYVVDGKDTSVVVHNQSGKAKQYKSISEFFLNQINSKMQFILGGDGKSPFQERQQWTDGCNLVALKPGVALTYDRNPETDKALRKVGYKTIEAQSLLADIKSGKVKASQVQNTIIRIPSSQLSRARGGSHCMTCPLQRQDI